MFIYKYILYNGSICICNLAICFVPKRMKKINYEMKWNFNAMIMFFFLTWKAKWYKCYEQMLHKLCVKQEQRETERERGRSKSRERVIGTGW